MESQEFKLIRYCRFEENGFRWVICSVCWGFEWISSTVRRGRAVRKFGKCESKLKVLSCQPAIRQQGGCNELCVCMCVCVCMRFWGSKKERENYWLSVYGWMPVLQTGHFFSFFLSLCFNFPYISFTHTLTHVHSHTSHSNDHLKESKKNKKHYRYDCYFIGPLFVP